jgi:protein ImuB
LLPAHPAFPEQAGAHPAQSGRRFLSVNLPRLSTDRIARLRNGPAWRLGAHPEAAPLVIAGRRGNAVRIAALDEKAAMLGISRGMGLADARGMVPLIEAVEEDPQADSALLKAVACWADRYTPLVAIDMAARPGEGGLILDITGCAGLFGGEASLLADLLARLFHQGFAATGAIASTPGAAHALARYRPIEAGIGMNGSSGPPAAGPPAAGRGPAAMPVVAPDRTAAAIAPLPTAGLRLDGETLSALARLGLRSIGQIMERPRAPLARRFGRELLLRLDQALGAIEESISPRLPVPVRIAERRLGEPVSRMEDVELLVERLAANLSKAMELRGEGARSLELALFRVDGAVSRARVGTARPLRDAGTIARLFRERLAALHDSLDAGCGYDLVRLAVLSSESFDPQEPRFFERGSGADAAVGLADRLAARLGPGAVLRAVPHDTHVPELAEQLQPASSMDEAPPQPAAHRHAGLPPLRPARLLARPEPVEALAQVPDGAPLRFRWRRVLHEVMRAEGPERIAGEWWRGGVEPRDYFRVEDAQGRRFWLFRRGLYGGGGEPRWFLHGLFA